MSQQYPSVEPKQNFPQLEENILKFWDETGMFQQSLEKNKRGNQHYVFYDGPPFANGLPHYGHLLTGYVKDLIPRYQTMKGKMANRRFGWDCHGLPAEMDAQKLLGINGRKDIIDYGIDRFNSQCQIAIQKYTKEWKAYVKRQARWVDFDNAYKTMDLNYMESVIWAFSELWRKGLIYEGNRVMPYSWALETPLSNFETRLDNSYRNRQDPAVTVLFELVPKGNDADIPTKMVAWTTTPWTLPSNLALAVGADIEYVVVEKEGTQYIIGKSAYEKFADQFEGAVIKKTVLGKELEFRKYKPLYLYFKNTPNAFQIFTGDFVSTEEGTGIVHLAPGFGEDDQALCAKYDIEPLCPIDSKGQFTAAVTDYEGQQVFEANKQIIADLKKKGDLIRHDTINHNYPHCWRTDTPLIYKVQKSWYVKVTAFKERMVELNQQINWIPFHVRDGLFGNWLEGSRDWSISRNRFFGTPIPVWKSDNEKYPRVDVYGSLAEIEKDFGIQLNDLHRPVIDTLTRANPDDPTGQSTMRRIEDVFDCWFESGSMPFAQLHYPFENHELFQENFPADFIVEYVAQTRGWFYTMMILSTALFDKPPFKNAICHGVINDEKGEKLSKSKRNYPDPVTVFETQGSDTLRWYLMSSSLLKGGDLQIDREGKGIADAARKVIIPMWNAYSFFCLYANIDDIKAEATHSSANLLDQYILSKTAELINRMSNSLDHYDIPKGCSQLEEFVETLNNWYIRRSRERFWRKEKDSDKVEAYNTLFTVLTILTRLSAPFLPLISETIFKGLTKENSVHLVSWPDQNELACDKGLIADMDKVIEICSQTLSIRKKHNIRVRQPLAKLTVYLPSPLSLEKYNDIISSEVNVKQVEYSNSLEGLGTQSVVLNSKKVAPALGQKFQRILSLVKSGKWTISNDNSLAVEDQIIAQDDYEVKVLPKPGLASKTLEAAKGLIILDTAITQQLWEEGLIRDFIRIIQNSRKEMDLFFTEKVGIQFSASPQVEDVIVNASEYIKSQIYGEYLINGIIKLGGIDVVNESIGEHDIWLRIIKL